MEGLFAKFWKIGNGKSSFHLKKKPRQKQHQQKKNNNNNNNDDNNNNKTNKIRKVKKIEPLAYICIPTSLEVFFKQILWDTQFSLYSRIDLTLLLLVGIIIAQ